MPGALQVRNVQNIVLIILLLKIVNKREGLDSLELQYNSLSMLVKVYARMIKVPFIVMCHVCVVFLRHPPIAIVELPKCLSHEYG